MFNVPSTLNGVCNLEHWYWQSQPKTNEKYIQKRAQYQTLVDWKRLNGLETCKYYFLSKRNDNNKHWNNVLHFPAAQPAVSKQWKEFNTLMPSSGKTNHWRDSIFTLSQFGAKTIPERLQLIFNVFCYMCTVIKTMCVSPRGDMLCAKWTKKIKGGSGPNRFIA